MATNTTSAGFDASGLLDQAVSQFRGLNPNEPGQWPWMPKVAVFAAVAVGVVVVGWFTLLSTAVEELELERDREPGLKTQFESKLAQAVNLGELRKQKLQVQEYVTQLEKQLPGKAEMDALLSDINQAGLLRRTADHLARDRALSRHRRVCRRRGQPVAHRHAAQPGDRPAVGQGHHGCAVDGSRGTDLPLP
jgi:hypothetical protein